MKTRLILRRFISFFAILLIFGFFRTAEALPITAGFSPNNGTISSTNGGSYSVDVILSGFETGGLVTAFDLDVLYDSDLLNATGVEFNDLLGQVGLFEVLQSSVLSTGRIDFAAVSLLSDETLESLQSSLVASGGVITLATLNFDGVGSGITTLTFDWYKGQDAKGGNNEIIVGIVPEPGTILLLGSGLAAMVGVRRRSSSRSKVNAKKNSSGV